MAVLLYEGWDLHQSPYWGSLIPAGLNDYQGHPNWQHGTPVQMYFTDGYTKGRAGVVGKDYVTFTTDIAEGPIYRMAWWGKIHVTGSSVSSSYREIVSVGDSNNGYRRIGLVYRSGTDPMTASLAKFTGQSDFSGTTISDVAITFSETWAHYELYVNVTTDTIQVYKDGSLVDEVTGEIHFSTDLDMVWLRTPGNYDMAYDHIVVTDGDTLRDTTGYHAAGVTYAIASKDTTNSLRIRGRIQIDGTDYLATPRSINIDGNNDGYGPRASNVYYDYWFTNPDTAAAWGDELGITSWGLCRTDDTGGHAYIPSAALSYVHIDDDGYPLVGYIAAGATFSIDESVWQKTHANVTWGGHVDNYPRTDPPYDYNLIAGGSSISSDGPDPFNESEWDGNTYDELFFEDYISVTGPGCVTFTTITTDTPLTSLGFTFAEEYQTTYQDWETVGDGGDDFCSYFITGYKLHADGNKKFQSNYLTVNYETHALGSAYIQGVWDYSLANTPGDASSRSDTGRWGSTQQIYGPTNSTDYKHAFRKLKIRGHGLAMQMKVKCESGKPFFLNGWTMYVTGNSTT